jgi:hypothetical protein
MQTPMKIYLPLPFYALKEFDNLKVNEFGTTFHYSPQTTTTTTTTTKPQKASQTQVTTNANTAPTSQLISNSLPLSLPLFLYFS